MKIFVSAAATAAIGFAVTLLALSVAEDHADFRHNAAIALRVAIVVAAMAVAYFTAMRKTRQPGA